MAQRLSKDELEADALVTGYVRALSFYKDNKTSIIGAVVAVTVLIAGILWYVSSSSAAENNAREAMTYAEEQFLSGNFENALFGDEDAFEPGLVEIISRFPRTTAGNLAFYYAAVSFAEIGDYDSALQNIRRFDIPSGVMGVAPKSLHGMILMQLGQYSDASSMFERAANWDLNSATTPFNLLNAAEAAYAAGNYNRAATLARRIKSDYPNSQQAPNAQRLEGMLSARN
ncbi:MAG: tetratricopeptide repeat protein [Candidatus Cyclonatronum sp.]|uniref:tetratricopeptide repeat protein n=1 Tax=Cyclonatronum sp. TaxID=3024185 RepID=UPI0025BD3FA3|nr:tetratricopeptide repeat protein [Cyclonatronum sp.]MCC5933138.1 tetratricopeptide repeat protein [Balneolales bacterium]MCH8485526.1 tetratricopeptide repeat protein [Cyclonatronum sp.]